LTGENHAIPGRRERRELRTRAQERAGSQPGG
jgi:hypothetical protein